MALSKQAKIALWTALVIAFIFSGLTVSAAWFKANRSTVSADVTGSVVEEYFHCGNGTREEPYVITRPIHYYHLVEFYQRKTPLNATVSSSTVTNNFGSDYLYFQVGFDFDDDGTLEVYSYNDQGITDESKSTTLNMAYYSGENALMPIGTDEVPFIGSFDGGKTSDGGITIANLNIRCRESIPGGTRSTSDVGVFGYVADSGGGSASIIKNAYFDGLNIDLTGVASGSDTTSTETSVSHVETHSEEANVGYIVGHLHNYTKYDSSGPTNASPIFDVYVNKAKVQGGAGVKCGYGYIGKVDYIDGSPVSTHDIISDITELSQTKDGIGQGGSMNMANMYRRLRYYYRSMSGYSGSSTGFQGVFENNEPDFAWRVKRDIDIDGNEEIISRDETDKMLVNSYTGNGDDKKLGTVTMFNAHRASLADHSENYIYLHGGRWGYGNVEKEVEHRQMLLTIDGSHFLSVTGTGVSSYGSENRASASSWTVTGASTTVSTAYNGSTVYLQNNNGTLQLTPNEDLATVWQIDSDGSTLRFYSGNYELTCDGNGNWSLRNALIGYRIKAKNVSYYLGASSNSASADAVGVASENTALIWNTDGNKRLQTTDGRYLTVASGSTTTWKAKVTSSNANPFYAYQYNGSTYTNNMLSLPFPSDCNVRLQYRTSSYRYSIRIRASLDVNNGNYDSMNVVCIPAYSWNYGISEGFITSISFGPDTEYVPDSGMEYRSDNTSIIPLNVVKDGDFESKNNYYAAKKNNGYLISGSTYAETGVFDGNAQSNIRVSRYSVSRVSNSYNSSTKALSNIRTIHGSSDSLVDETLTSTEQATQLYTKSVADLKKTIDDEVTDVGAANAYVYGLHFMDSAISTDRLVKSQYALVNGIDKTNYELPVDAIDFNLHENRGFVNFFAGTYFANNNTFFSLHDISRSGNNISEIKEIEEIYSDGHENHSYVYKYSDGLYSQAYDFGSMKNIDLSGSVSSTNYAKTTNLANKPSTYTTLVFDTARIRVTNDTIGSALGNSRSDTLYYFEVPIHKGEYALGSVPTKNGAYLIYLDVGTNGTLGSFNINNLIASGPLFTQIGMSVAVDRFYINSVFNVGYEIPNGADTIKFSFETSVSEIEYGSLVYTRYDIVIVNTTGQPFSMNVLLSDNNNDPTDVLPYLYSIRYNGGTLGPYFGSNIFIGQSGETTMTATYS